MIFLQTIAPVSRRGIISSLLDGALAYLSRLRLIGTTRTAGGWARRRTRSPDVGKAWSARRRDFSRDIISVSGSFGF
jgi:hypothetical protein